MIEAKITAPLDLSLYRIEEGLAGLIEHRQERLADRENPADEQEVAAIDEEIRRYEIAQPAKVTGTVAVVRRWRAWRENAKSEIKRLQQIVTHIDCMESWLKEEYLKPILERLPEPKKGARKLTGLDGSTITLKGNGGVAPLEITDSSLIPDELCTYTLKLTGAQYACLLESIELTAFSWVRLSPERAPDNEAIRTALARPCERCGGTGETCPSGPSDAPMNVCEACGGSGRNGVPGARLLGRGARVECR